MTADIQDYSLFLEFIETYRSEGFRSIDPDNPLMIELERMMKQNKQFFYIADGIQLKVLFTSKLSMDMIGVAPEEVSFYHFMQGVHPDEIQRYNVGRTRLIRKAQEIFIAGEGMALMSTNFRLRNASGGYTNFLMQNYLFYSSTPYNTVFFLKIHTDISKCKKIKCGYHYHIGNDLSLFRYPDNEMLQEGNVFTKREFEIIKLIEHGLSSEQIAEKLFLSHYTVNTHRANILKKTGKAHISELIYDLQERGVL
jgi:DNA-binding CsgD family transcriptional regulator